MIFYFSPPSGSAFTHCGGFSRPPLLHHVPAFSPDGTPVIQLSSSGPEFSNFPFLVDCLDFAPFSFWRTFLQFTSKPIHQVFTFCCHFLTSQRSFCSLEVVRVTLLFNLRRCAISQKVMTLVTSSDRLLLEVCQVLSVSPQTLYPDVGLSLTSACMWGD